VFERFTERARQVIVLAQEEALLLKHDFLGTEHLLLGLLRDEVGVPREVLEGFDVTVEEVRAQVARIVGPGSGATHGGMIPFSPRAKRVLELALRESNSLGHNHIGAEHILLGLVREGEGTAARILLDFDLDAETVRSAVIRALSGPTLEPGSAARPREGFADELLVTIAPSWEYDVVPIAGVDELTTERLNERGAEAWDLVAVVGEAGDLRLVFKRPSQLR
jgi:ATP-dependent Clp protease ATP-binding subunit ClpC